MPQQIPADSLHISPRAVTVATAAAMLRLTVKSGSEFMFTLPDDLKEQSIVLKITH